MLPPTLPRSFRDLADDTEESVAGSSLHQDAIITLYTGLCLHRDLSALPWFVCYQFPVIIPRQAYRPYQAMPDVIVHPTLGRAHRTALDIATEGPPALAIEVVSPTTAKNDINERSGKAGAYAHSGIAEYLVFDPEAEHIGAQVWARRARGSEFVPWLPETDGRWHSTALDLSFAPLGILLRVYDSAGTLVPLTSELALQHSADMRQIAERDRQYLADQQRIAERDRQYRADQQRIADLAQRNAEMAAEIERLKNR
jgi:Putative restriction endonuclease